MAKKTLIEKDVNGAGLSSYERFTSEYLKLVKKHGITICKSGDRLRTEHISDHKDPAMLENVWGNILETWTPVPYWLQKELDAKRVREAEEELSNALEAERIHKENQNNER